MNALHDILTTQQCAKEDRLIELREKLKRIRKLKADIEWVVEHSWANKDDVMRIAKHESEIVEITKQIHILDPRSDLNNL